MISGLGLMFYLNTAYLNATNMLIWLSYNGPKKDARKYKFTIDMVNGRDEAVLSGTRFCVPCDTPGEVVKEEFLGIVINQKLAQEVNIEDNPANEPMFNVDVRFFLAPINLPY